ncbi:MAG: DUF3362 domain-containing protein, partial [Burkholderiaceae bacterium]|nr:DUF3362 domain-containing protein [Burkholderiaceae bacterium]
AFLRYHDPANWTILREALRRMGRADLIGNGPQCLVPAWKSAPAGGFGARIGVGQQKQPQSRKAGGNKPAKPLAGKFAAGSKHRKGGVPVRSGKK